MVKKLFKYEFIYYFRTLGLFLPVVPILGLMVRIFSAFDTDNTFIRTALILSAIFCFMSAMALLLGTMIVGILRFYKNMYSAEGYLSFTLPVTNTQHILVKLVTHLCFMTLSLVAIVAGALIAVPSKAVQIAFREIAELLKYIPTPHVILYIVEILLLCVVSAAATTLLYYAFITIGQTAKKNRVLMSIIAYFIYYAITQTVYVIFTVIISILGIAGALDFIGTWISTNPISFFHVLLIGLTLFSATLGVLYFYITKRIMTRKLNLE